MKKRETFASRRKKKKIEKKNKYIRGISLLLILGLVFLFDISSPNAKYDQEMSYKIYLNNEYLGRISDPGLIDAYLLERTKQYQQEYSLEEIHTPEDFVVVPEVLKDGFKNDDDKVIERFKKRAEFTVDAYVVSVKRVEHIAVEGDSEEEKDELIEQISINEFNVLNKDDFNIGLEKYIRLFVTEDEYRRIMNKEPLPELEEDKLIVYDFYLDGDITIQKKRMNIDGLLKNSDEIINYLLFKSPAIEKQREHVVKRGDTVSSIGIEYQLMVDELILLNESIKTKDTILGEGIVLNVTQTNPIVTVVKEHFYVTREVVPYRTVVEYDPSRYSYREPWVKTAGVNGERKMKYSFTSVNGEIQQGSNVVESETLSEPINRVLVKGSKTSSRIGTGYFRWPTVSRYVTAYYGYYAPFGVRKFHYAVDIAGRLNDPIYAIDNGVVSDVSFNYYGGYTITINHNNGYVSKYAHLSTWPLVKKGAVVNKGAYIGKMGKSGKVTGVHLHLELRKNGVRINPYPYIKGWR